jgi:pimeloyl-ACP methyl ester carboxylesterase
MPTIETDGAQLYYEACGHGPPLLLIMGATGDGGHFAALSALLVDAFTVITYDRRGNSRSPRPPGWTTTSVEEQADDAAALLRALDLAPAAVFGTSAGGTIALCLALRHPDVVRGVVVHEPPLLSVLESDEAGAAVAAIVGRGMAAGGPPAALEAFWRFVAGDASWDDLDEALRDRMVSSAETFLGIEIAAFERYRPDDSALAALEVPVEVLVSEQGPPFIADIAAWLAGRLGVSLARTPGTHTPYQDRPRELADAIQPFLLRASDPAAG